MCRGSVRGAVTLICISLLLSGCGLAARREAQERQSAVVEQVRDSVAACDQSFPKQQSTAVARARCLGEATAPIRPLVPYPDLYDQEVANRNALAEQVQAGKLSQVQYEAQFAQMHSATIAEEQRRNLSNRSVQAQEATAAAASSPVICNKIGNSTICN